MKRLAVYFIMLGLVLLPQILPAAMGDYCSAPPYVTRTVAPNIMVLMDNSSDMLGEAYPGAYDPALSYEGYFRNESCYAGDPSGFSEVFKVPATFNSYTKADTCPSAAPYRGNLLNWATTSMADVLQKTLVGGLTASRQANSHTLISDGGTWTKPAYGGCVFTMSSGTLTVSDQTFAGECLPLSGTPGPIADDIAQAVTIDPLETFWAMFTRGLGQLTEALAGQTDILAGAATALWEQVELIPSAWAAAVKTTSIATVGGSQSGFQGETFDLWLECKDNCPKSVTYEWSLSGHTAFLSSPAVSYVSKTPGKSNIQMKLTGTAATAGTHSLTVTMKAPGGNPEEVTSTYAINIAVRDLDILTGNVLANAEIDRGYYIELLGKGGTSASNYSWALDTGSVLPTGLSLTTGANGIGVISGMPTNTAEENTTFNFTVVLTDSGTGSTFSKTFSIALEPASAGGLASQTYTVKVDVYAEALDPDINGNNVWDVGETWVDDNGDSIWQGKSGVFQEFWDDLRPRARWGMTKFSSGTVVVEESIPANNAATFFTSIQNANPTGSIQLADGLHGAINYYGYISPYGSASGTYTKGTADPIDSVSCRKNFVLIVTSGHDVGGSAFGTTTACSFADPLVQNACYGATTDMRSDSDGKQAVSTYIVHTGTANADVLRLAAEKGDGEYYAASGVDLKAKLQEAIASILAQAASGTAVSVLTTSSRGAGSMVQAYFLPVRNEGQREIKWTGYTQNLWVDTLDNLREDTVNDNTLKMAEDKVLKIFYQDSTNETKVATFTTNAEGLGDGSSTSLESCSNPTIKDFDQVEYLWEAGDKLALKRPNSRTLFTAKRAIRMAGASSFSLSVGNNAFTVANVNSSTGAISLTSALDPDATYTAEKIVRYVRGECIETGVTGDTVCGTVLGNDFRDRRVTVAGGDTNGNVWKLGDIISSTPKVFANTPVNTYHLDYGDATYYNYIAANTAATDYKKRLSVAFVGANDGVLHAFRVGHIKDKNLGAGVKAKFENSSSDTAQDKLGEELWGYIPLNAFPYLKYLADPDYCHIYFNDLSVRLVDASLGKVGDTAHDGPDDVRVKESWKTILIGGMRFGGAGGTALADFPKPPMWWNGFSVYYAIDVTDPANPVPLWEFSDQDMGYATGFPSIVRTGASNKNGNWYVVFGSGSRVLPKNFTDVGRSAGSGGYLYILDLKTGAMVKKISVGHDAMIGDILAIDYDKDYASEALYFGTSYLDTTWKGKLMRLDIPNQSLSSFWTPSLTTLFAGDYPFTASPDAAKDAAGNVWIYAGSGKYYSDLDDEDASDQIFLGIKDHSTAAKTTSDLDNRTATSTAGTVTGTEQVCGYDADNETFGLQTVVTSITPTTTTPTASTTGWYILLSNGERTISRPLAVGGLVDFLTYEPSSEPCSYGGNSYLYAVDYTTGAAPTNIAIRASETTGKTTTGSVTVEKGVLLGPGAPPTGEAIIVPPPDKDEVNKKIQIATGVIVEAKNKPTISITSKLFHWLKLK